MPPPLPATKGHLVSGSSWLTKLLLLIAIAPLGLILFQDVAMALWSKTAPLLASLALAGSAVTAQSVDVSWHAPSKSHNNANFSEILNGEGKWGYIYDSSVTPDEKYGTYNWCNMPHVRAKEYVKASDEYDLKYVELVCI